MVAADSLRINQTNDRTFNVDGVVGNTSADAGGLVTQDVINALTAAGLTIAGSSSDPLVTGDSTGTATSDADVSATQVTGLVNIPTVPPVVIPQIDFSQAVIDIIANNPNPYLGTPSQPSQPVVTPIFAGLKIGWNGLNADGTPDKVPDFDRLEVHVSTVGNFVPTASTLVSAIQATTTGGSAIVYSTTAYGVTHYVRFVAVTRSGASSVPSLISTGAPLQLDTTDISFDISVAATFKDLNHHIY